MRDDVILAIGLSLAAVFWYVVIRVGLWLCKRYGWFQWPPKR